MSFKSDIDVFTSKIQQLNSDYCCKECTKDIAARLLRACDRGTPTITGTLKRGWTGGIEQTVEQFASTLNIEHVGDKYTVDISNETEYASYVEYGHRQEVGRYVPALGKKLVKGWVEGNHVLTDSSKELQDKAPAIIDYKLRELLKGL